MSLVVYLVGTNTLSIGMTTLLIDNYDSFTWNIYQALSILGARVSVVRNDQITLEQAIAINPRNLVISPGPGHPSSAQMSNVLLEHFGGRIPVLGVCLGMQCMVTMHGGIVESCGEYVHGKTTSVNHDQKGLFVSVSQGVECTRYHSLAAAAPIPSCLEVTCTTLSGIVMGVRHKAFIMEGVQFHPESIASQEGETLLANFLEWTGSHWSNMKIDKTLVRRQKDKPEFIMLNSSQENADNASSVLEQIKFKRIQDVKHQQQIPGQSLLHLQKSIKMNLAPKIQDFPARLTKSIRQSGLAVLAEIKRASPSKGNIDLAAHAPTQALVYARGGAACISVLTEPKWFKGSMTDMQQVRQSIENLESRPCVLCKDFIVSEYQVYQARLNGADTILLIVAILPQALLTTLLRLARSLGMEPLVEVANTEETQRAVQAGSRIIGVNNRDLHTFNVDMNRTNNLSKDIPKDVILLALSGITLPKDVERYRGQVQGVLIGQGLMEAAHPPSLIQSILGPIVKLCGITSSQDALMCRNATHLGLIYAKSPRQINETQARDIIKSLSRLDRTPATVGVFMDHSVDFINSTCVEIAQVHFQMSNEDLKMIQKPVWYVIFIGPETSAADVHSEMQRTRDHVQMYLVHVKKGYELSKASKVLDSIQGQFIVAGGLESDTCSSFLKFGGIDICSGVEKEPGIKSQELVDRVLIKK